MIEALHQIKKRGKLSDIPALYRSIQDNLETDLSAAQIAQLALFGLKLNTDEITTHLFEGSCQTAPKNGLNISYVVIDEKKRVELIEAVFGVKVSERPQITLPGPVQNKPEPAAEPLPSEPPAAPPKLSEPPAAPPKPSESPPAEEPAPEKEPPEAVEPDPSGDPEEPADPEDDPAPVEDPEE